MCACDREKTKKTWGRGGGGGGERERERNTQIITLIDTFGPTARIMADCEGPSHESGPMFPMDPPYGPLMDCLPPYGPLMDPYGPPILGLEPVGWGFVLSEGNVKK